MENTTLSYVDYDTLEADPLFPNSPLQFIGRIIKGSFQNFIKAFPKSLFIPLLITFILGAFYIFYLAVIVDTLFVHYYASTRLGQLFVYILPGVLPSESPFPGFTHIHSDGSTLPMVMPFMFLFTYLLKDLLGPLFSKKTTSHLFKDLSTVSKNKKAYKLLADKKPGTFYLKGMIVAFVLGLLIKNPLTFLLLSLIFFLSFAKNNKSNLLIFFGTFLASRNIKKKTHTFINFGNIALFILGLAYGFLLYFILALLLFFFLNYHIYARIAFTILFIVLFVFLLLGGRKVQISIKSLAVVVIAVSYLTLTNKVVHADDGGWSESGGFFDWLANAGTKIIAALGLTGAASAAIGWAANLFIGNAAGFFGVGPILQFGNLLAGFGQPSGSQAANLTFAQAALNSAFGSIGLGGILGDAVGGINDALSGGTGGSGNSGSSGSGSRPFKTNKCVLKQHLNMMN